MRGDEVVHEYVSYGGDPHGPQLRVPAQVEVSVRLHPSPGAGRGLQHCHVVAGLLQHAGGGKARQTGADHQHLR